MDFRDTPEEARFRREVREFIAEHLPAGYGTPDYFSRFSAQAPENGLASDDTLLKRWNEALAARGWLAPHWPREYGGAGMTVSEQFIFNEEMALARAPEVSFFGVGMIGPILMLYGTEEQKREHLPKIARGEVIWCQGYSEPGSGSDLASLQTRAVRDGDDYVINGQKIWTSGAHRAQWMFLLARTNPDAPKHRGISMFLLDLKTPGVTISPLINMAGDHGFNQVFFDNVRVPATNLVGEENRGWYIGVTLLDFERSGIRASIALKQTVDDLIQFAREMKADDGRALADHPSVRAELAERLVEAELARLFSLRIISLQKRGLVPNFEASVNKLFRSETEQRIARTGMNLIGMYGNLHRDPKWAPLRGQIARMYLLTVASTIAAGTSEIQRNVIATRGIGLPRA
jgi:alkylation response protein AidB-like acyl-CoA dehydrogenase